MEVMCCSPMGEQPAELQSNHSANQLVASANLAEMQSPGGQIASLEFLRNQPVNFALGNTVVPAGRLHGLEFAVVNPLLERRIADAQNVCCLAWRQKFLHGWSPGNAQNSRLRDVYSIRFYMIGPSTDGPG